MIQWEDIDARYFEKFIFHFLKELGFKNRKWYGRGGGDKGRDVTAQWIEQLPFEMSYERKWIFQCKRWKKMPSSSQILKEISTAVQHQPDHWVMVLPLDPTANVMDYLAKLEKNFNFKLSIIPKAQLEEILFQYPYLINVLKEGHLPEGSEEDEA
ncbi:restriction endonuclease [Priestia megaterium]|uniref:restriction endonuclease n=1 Tax=Priestia megaterium TaxID=1404 RepID=UPI0021BFE5BD|nr:restriction endonuclease [Priestia megaterium]MCT9852295.1 restriction endonuclease [Priestia megaterium]MDF1963049.1 restriction endonuclease [Priestia megaterium]